MSQRVGELESCLIVDEKESVRVNDNGTAWEAFAPMDRQIYDPDNDGIVDKARELTIIGRNQTGSPITKGSMVYVTGASGNHILIAPADKDSESTSSKTLGMVVADIAHNANGTVAVQGTVNNLDTNAYAAGTPLYLGDNGGWTATKPVPPAHAVFVGWVTAQSSTAGTIVLHIQNGYELDELHDVLISTTPSDGQVLTYEASTSLWKPKTPSGGGGVAVLDTFVDDVDATNTTANCLSTSVGAGKLNANGASLRMKGTFSITGTTGSATFAPTFGGNALGTYSISANGTYSAEVLVIRTSSTSFRALLSVGSVISNSYTEVTGLAAGWFDSARTFEMEISTNNAGRTITSRFGTIEFLPSA